MRRLHLSHDLLDCHRVEVERWADVDVEHPVLDGRSGDLRPINGGKRISCSCGYWLSHERSVPRSIMPCFISKSIGVVLLGIRIGINGCPCLCANTSEAIFNAATRLSLGSSPSSASAAFGTRCHDTFRRLRELAELENRRVDDVKRRRVRLPLCAREAGPCVVSGLPISSLL